MSETLSVITEGLGTSAGWMSIIPAIIVLFLTFWTRRVIESLLAGVLAGYLLWKGVGFFPELISDIFVVVSQKLLVQIILICGLFGGLLALLIRSGALAAFGTMLANLTNKSRIATKLTTYVMGVVLFIDDFSSALTVSSTMTKASDDSKVSRPMLAYIADTTAAPTSTLIPFSTWGIFLIAVYEARGLVNPGDGFQAFVWTIPYILYSWIALLICLLAVLNLIPVIGPMRKAERDARQAALAVEASAKKTAETKAKPPVRQAAVVEDEYEEVEELVEEEVETPVSGEDDSPAARYLRETIAQTQGSAGFQKPTDMVISDLLNKYSQPAATKKVVVKKKVKVRKKVEADAEADTTPVVAEHVVEETVESHGALAVGNFLIPMLVLIGTTFYYGDTFPGILLGLAAAFILFVAQKIITPAEYVDTFLEGFRSLIQPLAIIVLGFMLADVNESLGFTAWIVDCVEQYFTAPTLGVGVFLGVAFVTFAVGSSWPVLLISVPIIFQLAFSLDAYPFLALGAALSGAVFGSHCSPYAETTVMTSWGSGVDNMNHVITQLPYALLSGALTVIGFYILGFLV